MADYVILTDSSCDIDPELLARWEVPFVSLTVKFDDEKESFANFDRPFPDFYRKMRDGGVARTAAVNIDDFLRTFEPLLKQGKDLLYIGFSSGLSTTVNSGAMAAAELMEQYPERKIVTVDTYAASAGFGMLVYLAVQEKKRGATLEQAAKFVEDTRFHLCHWFTVDDLVYLKRGGRVSAATALLGTALNVKPVLHVDNEGHLIKITQVHGRKKSIRRMAEKLGETILPDSPVFISHGDCIEDAEMLKDILKNEYGKDVDLITYVGSVIGAHSGPGTLALFFRGKER